MFVSSPKISDRNLENVLFLFCFCIFFTENEAFNSKIKRIQYTPDVRLKHYAAILLLSRRTLAQTQKICLMKTYPLLFTQAVRHLKHTFVPVEPIYYQQSSYLPPVPRLVICARLHDAAVLAPYDFTAWLFCTCYTAAAPSGSWTAHAFWVKNSLLLR